MSSERPAATRYLRARGDCSPGTRLMVDAARRRERHARVSCGAGSRTAGSRGEPAPGSGGAHCRDARYGGAGTGRSCWQSPMRCSWRPRSPSRLRGPGRKLGSSSWWPAAPSARTFPNARSRRLISMSRAACTTSMKTPSGASRSPPEGQLSGRPADATAYQESSRPDCSRRPDASTADRVHARTDDSPSDTRSGQWERGEGRRG